MLSGHSKENSVGGITVNSENNKEKCIGGLVGKSIGGKIENCHASGKIIINGVEQDINAGGLVGKVENTEIINSSSDVQIIENGKFEEFKELISRNINDGIKRKELLDLVEQMKDKKRSKDYVKIYTNFISVLADHITIFSPFIPFLTQFIVHS